MLIAIGENKIVCNVSVIILFIATDETKHDCINKEIMIIIDFMFFPRNTDERNYEGKLIQGNPWTCSLPFMRFIT